MMSPTVQAGRYRRHDDPPVVVAGVDPDQLAFTLSPPTDTPTRRASPFRRYDLPMLRYVADTAAVTSHQVVYRFATHAGRTPGHVVRVVRALVDRGWLRASRLDPDHGRASRQVITLTDAGWKQLGATPQTDPQRAPRYVLEHCLQEAEYILEQSANGWRLIPQPDEAWRALKSSALTYYRRPGRSELDTAHMLRIERLPAATLPLPVWQHEITGAVKFAVPSRRGINLPALLAELPNLHIWPSIRADLVGADTDRIGRDRELLRRWAARNRYTVALDTPPSFRTRPAPRFAARLTPGDCGKCEGLQVRTSRAPVLPGRSR
jgi:DNA-binding MarR family transcriptional regulator